MDRKPLSRKAVSMARPAAAPGGEGVGRVAGARGAGPEQGVNMARQPAAVAAVAAAAVAVKGEGQRAGGVGWE